MSFVAVVRCRKMASDCPELSPPFIIRADMAFFYRLDSDFGQLLVEKRSVSQEADRASQAACDQSAKIDV